MCPIVSPCLCHLLHSHLNRQRLMKASPDLITVTCPVVLVDLPVHPPSQEGILLVVVFQGEGGGGAMGRRQVWLLL